jgi:hypothetical protein
MSIPIVDDHLIDKFEQLGFLGGNACGREIHMVRATGACEIGVNRDFDRRREDA